MASQNFALVAGRTQSIEFDVKDASGTAIDLSGAVVTLALEPADTEAESEDVLVLSSATGAIEFLATRGRLRVNFAPDDTAALGGQVFDGEVVAIDFAGNVIHAATCLVTVLERVATNL